MQRGGRLVGDRRESRRRRRRPRQRRQCSPVRCRRPHRVAYIGMMSSSYGSYGKRRNTAGFRDKKTILSDLVKRVYNLNAEIVCVTNETVNMNVEH